MGAPNVTISVEPGNETSVFYLLLAPTSTHEIPAAQLSLVLWIKNPGDKSFHASSLKISFIGGSPVSDKVIPLDLDIIHNQTTEWNFNTSDNVILPFATPTFIKLSLYCDDFDSPASVTKTLSPYQTSFPPGSYGFPSSFEDLNEEYWKGVSAKHTPAGGGTQLYAYDMFVIGYNPEKNAYTELRTDTNTSGNNNTDYRIWGKPIYAMADGVVRSFKNDVPTNPTPTLSGPGVDLSPPQPVEGNHFYIQHGENLVMYAHMQAGTLTPNLLHDGTEPGIEAATVHKGDQLGLAGNSGNSSRPHLHISAIKGTVKWEGPPAPIPFHDIQVLGLSILNSQANQPWVEVEGMGLPAEDAAILPFIGDISPLDLNKFNAIVNILGLGVLKGGEGTGYTPSGKPIHIGPSDPGGMVRLSPDKRDILVGLAMTEIASVVSNSEAKQKIVKVGLDVISSAVNNLRKPPIHDE